MRRSFNWHEEHFDDGTSNVEGGARHDINTFNTCGCQCKTKGRYKRRGYSYSTL